MGSRVPRGFVAAFVPWPPGDLGALRELAPAGVRPLPWAALVARFPGRTRAAIALARRRLGLASAARWTPAQDVVLDRDWQRVPKGELEAALAPHPWAEIARRALDVMALDRLPQGWATVQSLAEAYGFERATFDALLRRQRVTVSRHTPRRPGLRGWRIVDEAEARAAVDRDMALETITAAAARLGLPGKTLAEWVAAALRRKRARRPPGRTTLRRPPAFFDKVAEAHGWAAGLEMLGAAERRTGVPRDVLRARCEVVHRGRGAHALVRREDVDRAAEIGGQRG